MGRMEICTLGNKPNFPVQHLHLYAARRHIYSRRCRTSNSHSDSLNNTEVTVVIISNLAVKVCEVATNRCSTKSSTGKTVTDGLPTTVVKLPRNAPAYEGQANPLVS